MMILFLILAQVLIWLLIRYFAKKKFVWNGILLICSAILLAVWMSYFGGSEFININILFLSCAIPLSYVLYLISLFIVGTKFTTENLIPFKRFIAKGKLFKTFRQNSIRNIFSSIYEELLYRWFLQNALYMLTNSTWISVTVTVIVFWAVHIRKGIAIVQMIDIFTFSLVITFLFYFTVNPIYCIIIHIVRNQLVICQKYVTYQNQYERKTKYLKILQNIKAQQNGQ